MYRLSIIFVLEEVASLAVAEGQWEGQHCHRPARPLGEAGYRNTCEAGRGLTLEEAITRALEK